MISALSWRRASYHNSDILIDHSLLHNVWLSIEVLILKKNTKTSKTIEK